MLYEFKEALRLQRELNKRRMKMIEEDNQIERESSQSIGVEYLK